MSYAQREQCEALLASGALADLSDTEIDNLIEEHATAITATQVDEADSETVHSEDSVASAPVDPGTDLIGFEVPDAEAEASDYEPDAVDQVSASSSVTEEPTTKKQKTGEQSDSDSDSSSGSDSGSGSSSGSDSSSGSGSDSDSSSDSESELPLMAAPAAPKPAPKPVAPKPAPKRRAPVKRKPAAPAPPPPAPAPVKVVVDLTDDTPQENLQAALDALNRAAKAIKRALRAL